MKDCCHLALSKQAFFQSVELMDSEILTKKGIIKKKEG
jgi:hypothetical protein